MAGRSQDLIRRGKSRAGKASERGTLGKAAGDAGPGVRLQRFMAEAGVASRRDCEKLIEDGRVQVNGQMVSRLPVFIDPVNDHVVVDGRGLERGGGVARAYLMLNKPARTLGTTRDDEALGRGGRRTVLDLIDHPAKSRLFPVGRLGFHDTGLVLLTNDGLLAERLTHARYGVTKTYRVVLRGGVNAATIDALRRRVGLRREEGDGPARANGAPPADVAVPAAREERGVRMAGMAGPDTVIELSAREGASQRLAQVLAELGCQVKLISRVAIGPLVLRGVAPGAWRELERDELHELMTAVGLGGTKKAPKRPGGNRGSGKRVGGPTAKRPLRRSSPGR